MGANISSIDDVPGLLWSPVSMEDLDFVIEKEDQESNFGKFDFVDTEKKYVALKLVMEYSYGDSWHSGSIAIPPSAQMASRFRVNFKIDSLRPNGWYCNLYFQERAHGRVTALVCKFDASSLKVYGSRDPIISRGFLPDSQNNHSFVTDVRIVAGRWEEFDAQIDWPEQEVRFYVSNRFAGRIPFNNDTGTWNKLVAVQASGYAKGGTSYWGNIQLSTLTDDVCDAASILLQKAQALHVDQDELTSTIVSDAMAGKFFPPKNHPATSDLVDLIKCADSQINLQQVTPMLKEAVTVLLQRLDQVCAAFLTATADVRVREQLKLQLSPMIGRYARGYDWAYNDLVCWGDEASLEKYLEFANAQEAVIATKYSAIKPTQLSNDLFQISTWASVVQPRVSAICKKLADKFAGQHLSGASVKSLFRAQEKTLFSNDTDVKNVADMARGGVEFDSLEKIHGALEWFTSGGDETVGMGITVVRIKNRFGEASAGGWRDALVNFHFTNDTSRKVVAEIQIMHSHLLTIRKYMGAHKDYSIYRAASELMEYHGDAMN